MDHDRRQTDVRFDNIDQGIRGINLKLEGLIRLETRHENSVKRIESHAERLMSHDKRLQHVEQVIHTNSKAVTFFERVGWFLFTLAAGSIIYSLREYLS